jgi:hypothetical protein
MNKTQIQYKAQVTRGSEEAVIEFSRPTVGAVEQFVWELYDLAGVDAVELELLGNNNDKHNK